MRITVTTTSQKLSDILSKTQILNINRANSKSILIQNLWDYDIYISTSGPATIINSVLIKANYMAEDINFQDLSRIELISDGTNSTNIRMITT